MHMQDSDHRNSCVQILQRYIVIFFAHFIGFIDQFYEGVCKTWRKSERQPKEDALNEVGKKISELENMQTKHMSHNGLSTRIMFGISNVGVCH